MVILTKDANKPPNNAPTSAVPVYYTGNLNFYQFLITAYYLVNTGEHDQTISNIFCCTGCRKLQPLFFFLSWRHSK